MEHVTLHLNKHRSSWPMDLRDRGPAGEVRRKVRVLTHLSMDWDEADVQRVTAWWQAGTSLAAMGEALQRDMDEVALLLMHLARRGVIEGRPGGAYGMKEEI